jgi:D-alanyl-D-alanine carboxypeptidase/D-alanyl-D-alanine-endopeptidase (penicillin-binding protein 4)
VTGQVIGDDTAFDDRRGVPSEGFRIGPDVAPLGALMLNRGTTGLTSPYYQPNFAKFAATALAQALRDIGVDVPKRGRAGDAPSGALALAGAESEPLSTLLEYQNVPSDNYIAEMLLKATGMTDEVAGTTARGAAVVRDTAAELFDLTPRVVDGSGLSRGNATSPREVVDLLAGKFEDTAFFDSLAVAGVSGTLENRLKSRATRGRCHGKTGTLSDVSNLVGYCETRSGDTLAFAILNNRISPYTAHGIQDRMVYAIARYSG